MDFIKNVSYQPRLHQCFCNGLNQALEFICCVPSLSPSPSIAPLTGTILYANNLQVELLIINTDSSEGENKQHLAARTFNEPVMREFSLQNTNLFFSMLEWLRVSAFLFCMPTSFLDPLPHYKFYSYRNTACAMYHKPGKSRGGFLGWCLHLCFTSTTFEGKANRKIKLEMWVGWILTLQAKFFC